MKCIDGESMKGTFFHSCLPILEGLVRLMKGIFPLFRSVPYLEQWSEGSDGGADLRQWMGKEGEQAKATAERDMKGRLEGEGIRQGVQCGGGRLPGGI